MRERALVDSTRRDRGLVSIRLKLSDWDKLFERKYDEVLNCEFMGKLRLDCLINEFNVPDLSVDPETTVRLMTLK